MMLHQRKGKQVPPLTPLLFDILLRFRKFNVPMVADIEKAFLDVEIDQSDRDVLIFLWAKDAVCVSEGFRP